MEVAMFPNSMALETNHNEPLPPEPLLSDSIPAKAHLDAERGVFVTSKGNEIELTGKPISKLMLERILSEGKPKIPRKEVLLLGKHKEMQANANDPDYLALMREWESETNVKTMRYICVIGVKGQPPQDFVDEQRQFFPDATDADMKYLYVASLLPDDDINLFANVLTGQYNTTAEGVEDAANFSPSA